VIVGFVNAAALLIIISQLGPLAGIDGETGANPLAQLMALAGQIERLNPVTLALGLACGLGMWLISARLIRMLTLFGFRLSADHPVSKLGPLLVAISAGVAVWAGNLNEVYDVAVIGEVPGGLPALTLPPFDWQLWLDLLPTSTMIAGMAHPERTERLLDATPRSGASSSPAEMLSDTSTHTTISLGPTSDQESPGDPVFGSVPDEGVKRSSSEHPATNRTAAEKTAARSRCLFMMHFLSGARLYCRAALAAPLELVRSGPFKHLILAHEE